MKKFYTNKHKEIFEYVGTSQHYEYNESDIFHTQYPGHVLKNLKTGELVTMLSHQLKTEFTPFFNDMNDVGQNFQEMMRVTINSLQGFMEVQNLNEVTRGELHLASKNLVEGYIRNFYDGREIHKDFRELLESYTGYMVIHMFVIKDMKKKEQENANKQQS